MVIGNVGIDLKSVYHTSVVPDNGVANSFSPSVDRTINVNREAFKLFKGICENLLGMRGIIRIAFKIAFGNTSVPAMSVHLIVGTNLRTIVLKEVVRKNNKDFINGIGRI